MSGVTSASSTAGWTKESASETQASVRVPGKRPNEERKKGPSNARPTHFLSLPLGQYPQLRNNVGSFQNALLQLQNTPSAIKGLDPSIIINPRRLHLTLGVMSLAKPKEALGGPEEAPKTVESALELLRSLEAQVSQEGPLRIPLRTLGAFESKKGARVLWISPEEHAVDEENPEETEGREKLQRVCDLVHKTFKSAGYITDHRPLKLHCTMINTSHRKPSSKRHILFSFDDILSSAPLRTVQRHPTTNQTADAKTVETYSSFDITASPATSPCDVENFPTVAVPLDPASVPTKRVVPVDMGTYTVSEIQLCVMGSHGPEDEYVSVGGISLNGGN